MIIGPLFLLGATALLAPVLAATDKLFSAANESAAEADLDDQRTLSTTASYNYDQSIISLYLSAAGE
jgi:hypothetical protein